MGAPCSRWIILIRQSSHSLCWTDQNSWAASKLLKQIKIAQIVGTNVGTRLKMVKKRVLYSLCYLCSGEICVNHAVNLFPNLQSKRDSCLTDLR